MSPIMLMMSFAFQSSIVPFLTISPQLDPESCDTPKWIAGLFGFPGPSGGAFSLAVYDEGAGPMLFVSGGLTASGLPAPGIARWDGRIWSNVGGGMSNNSPLTTYSFPVNALTVFDDGTGAALYAGGNFDIAGDFPANNIARWDGQNWTPLGLGVNGAISSMTTFDGSLVVGGTFSMAGAAMANRVAKWDGQTWSNLGEGLTSGTLTALISTSNSEGDFLFAARRFATTQTGSVDRWDGITWSPLGSGMEGYVLALAWFDDGTGPALFAAGTFTLADEVPCERVAKWNGKTWEPLASGINNIVYSLNVFDDGQGSRLLASGQFNHAGGIDVQGAATWDGHAWSPEPVIDGYPIVRQVGSYNDGQSDSQYAVGQFHYFEDFGGNGNALSILSWNGFEWQTVGLGLRSEEFVDLYQVITGLKAFDDGSGTALFTTRFENASQAIIAKSNGRSWEPANEGITWNSNSYNRKSVFAEFDDGTGSALYLGGDISVTGDRPGSHIAKWNGEYWESVGGGTDGPVAAMIVFDDGGGPALIVAGGFQQAGDIHANGIAKWDGQTWHASYEGLPLGYLYTLAVFDDGTGSKIYAGGVWGQQVYVYRWSGEHWEPFGTWGSELGLGPVRSLAAYDDGSGPKLFAAGEPHQSGQSGWTSRVLQWSDGQWSALPGTFTRGSDFLGPTVLTLEVLNDGSGSALYAMGPVSRMGGFTTGDLNVNGIVRWNGSQWSTLDGGLRHRNSGTAPMVYGAATFDDGTGNALFFGGTFKTADGWPSVGLAKWGCDVRQPIHGDLDFDGHVALDDLAVLTNCFNGPNPTNNDCAEFDPHPDFDMDLQDFAVLQRNFSE